MLCTIAVEPVLVLVVMPLVVVVISALSSNIRVKNEYFSLLLPAKCHKHAPIERFGTFQVCWSTKMLQVLMVPQYPSDHRSSALNGDHPSVSHGIGIFNNICAKPLKQEPQTYYLTNPSFITFNS